MNEKTKSIPFYGITLDKLIMPAMSEEIIQSLMFN